MRHQFLPHRSYLPFSGLALLTLTCFGQCADAPFELNVEAKQVGEWGGRVAGETLTQGDDLHHVKLVFHQTENPQKRSEVGITMKSDLPIFTKATMEVFSNVNTVFRIRVADASDNPYIVKTPVAAGTWTPVELVLDKSSGKTWPALTPYKVVSFLATTKDGENEQILEIKNLVFSGGAPVN